MNIYVFSVYGGTGLTPSKIIKQCNCNSFKFKFNQLSLVTAMLSSNQRMALSVKLTNKTRSSTASLWFTVLTLVLKGAVAPTPSDWPYLGISETLIGKLHHFQRTRKSIGDWPGSDSGGSLHHNIFHTTENFYLGCSRHASCEVNRMINALQCSVVFLSKSLSMIQINLFLLQNITHYCKVYAKYGHLAANK